MDWFKAVDTPLKWGGVFDWISPLWGLANDIVRRPSCGYVIPLDAVNPWMVKRLLKNEGIQYWGFHLFLDSMMFGCKRRDAARVQEILERNRIPYQGGI